MAQSFHEGAAVGPTEAYTANIACANLRLCLLCIVLCVVHCAVRRAVRRAVHCAVRRAVRCAVILPECDKLHTEM